MSDEKFGRFLSVTFVREGQTFTYDQLRLRVTIRKTTAEMALNQARIQIWNASRDFQKFIARPVLLSDVLVRPPYDTVFVKAGYSQPVPIAFSGVVYEALTHRMGTDWVTDITAFTYIEQRDLTYLERSYVDTSPLVILSDLFKAFKWPAPRLSVEAQRRLTSETLSTYTVSGMAFRSILTLLERYGMLLSVNESGPIVTMLGDEVDTGPDVTLPLVSRETGMVGSPRVTRRGIDVQTLYEPGIQPLRSFACQSDSLTATLGVNTARFKAISVESILTNRDNEFHSDVEAVYPSLFEDTDDISARNGPIVG